MWDWVDHIGWIVFRSSVSVAILSSLVLLGMLGCRQPTRRIALARAAILGSILSVPLVGLAPLPQFEVIATLRGAGVLPHPLGSLVSATAWPGLPLVDGPWPARALLGVYLAVVGACLAVLGVGCWGLVWVTRSSTAPSARAVALYEALPFPAWRCRPRLRIAGRVRRPVLLSIIRPTILIPPELDAETPDAVESLRLSFLHELAHAERFDPWFNLAGSLAQALWFFLPTIGWIRARMQLDHEFLADRRADLGFGGPGTYASTLVGMAAPGPDRQAPRHQPPAAVTRGHDSPLLQRVLMLVQCPFLVELRPPAWWSGLMSVVILLVASASACLNLDLRSELPSTPTPQTFRVASLTIRPQFPRPPGRSPVFELPLPLPGQFQLTLEVWGDADTLAHCRVVGQRLGPREAGTPAPSGSESWHQVEVRRGPDGLTLAVDGRPLPADPGVEGVTSRLAVEPSPDRPMLVRNLVIHWTQ